MKKAYVFCNSAQERRILYRRAEPVHVGRSRNDSIDAEPSEADVLEARRVRGIPEAAYCVACKIVEEA